MGEIPENRTPRQVEQYFSPTGNTAARQPRDRRDGDNQLIIR